MPDTMPSPTDVLRPLGHLRQVAQQYPGLWQQLDRLRAGRGKGLPAWPDWCYLPLAGTVATLTQGAPQPDLRPLGMQIGCVGALAAWRVTQGIYRFDPTVFEAVWDTPIAGDLPTTLLYHLPEWCCYVPVDPARPLWREDLALHGFFVHLEWDANTHHMELRFVLDAESPRQPPRAHIRRAHWHTYYVGEGSRKDPSKAQVRVRWLPPTPVGLPDELIPTIRPVT